jgi:imidazolonepropionase-like amidohydrolase
MRLRFALVTVVSALVMAVVVRSAGQAPAAPAGGGPIVIRGGTVIDVRTGSLQPDSVVVIENGRISRVGPAGQIKAPAGASVIDATGKFVMPGLWDSHAHTRDYDGDLNINHGVTSTMDMGNLMDWIIALQEARDKEAWIGPRIFPQGMSIGGTLGPHQWNAKTVADAEFGAKQNIAAGVSFLKVYQRATPEMVKAVADAAHAAGLNLTGHLGVTDAREAILAGIDALAHGSGIPAAISPPEISAALKAGKRGVTPDGDEFGPESPLAYSYMDRSKFDDMIKLMLEHHVRLEPNIVQVFHGAYPKWDQYQLETHRLAMRPELRYMRDDYEMYVRMWDTDYTYKYPPSPKLLARLRTGVENQQLFAKKYALAGGKLFVGTDNYYHVMAGLGVWHEMELLADGGVPPLAILQAATINPAEFVHQDKNLGTVEAGKLADVIILGKNPLENISNIRTLETVIQHGKVQTLGYKSNYRVLIPRPYLPVNGALPVPHITSLQPVAVPVGTKDLVVTIKGKDFNPLNRVLWDDVDLQVVEFSPTQLKVAVPPDLVGRLGTWKIHMITGGRVHQEGDNNEEVMVTLGKRIEIRWNGQKMSAEW